MRVTCESLQQWHEASEPSIRKQEDPLSSVQVASRLRSLNDERHKASERNTASRIGLGDTTMGARAKDSRRPPQNLNFEYRDDHQGLGLPIE